MNVKVKGRAFELEMYNELKKTIPSIRLSKWSGVTSDEPADLFGKHVLIETKFVKDYNDNEIKKWFKETQDNCNINQVAVLIVKQNYRGIKTFFHSKDLGLDISDIVMVYWPSGKFVIKMLEEKDDRKSNS